MLTFRMVRQALLFDLKFDFNLLCNPKITQENRLQWKFFQTCGRTHLQHSSPHDDRGKIVVSVLRPSLPAVLSISVIQPTEPTSRHVKKRNVHPWASC